MNFYVKKLLTKHMKQNENKSIEDWLRKFCDEIDNKFIENIT